MEDQVPFSGFEQALFSGSSSLLDYFPPSPSLTEVMKLPKQEPSMSSSLQLPPLLPSVEVQRPSTHNPNRFPSSPSPMIFPSPWFTSHSSTHEAIFGGNPWFPPYRPSPSFSPPLFSPAPPPCKTSMRQKQKAVPANTPKKRLKTTSEETQCLAKKSPWGLKKMNTETSLEQVLPLKNGLIDFSSKTSHHP